MRTLTYMPFYQILIRSFIEAKVRFKRRHQRNKRSGEHNTYTLSLVAILTLTIGIFVHLTSFAEAASPPQSSQSQQLQGQDLIKALAHEQNISALSKNLQAHTPHLSTKLLQWIRLTEYPETADFTTLRQFIHSNPDWPKRSTLIRHAEEKMPPTLRPFEVKSWFDQHPPKSFKGLTQYTKALKTLGYTSEYNKAIQTYWIKGKLSKTDTKHALKLYNKILTLQDHAQRIDTLIWQTRYQEAQWLLPLFSKQKRALFTARIKLATQDKGVNASIDKMVNSDLTNDAFLFERARWHRRKGNNDTALKWLNTAKTIDTKYAKKWWRERHILIRREIEAKDWHTALQIVQQHQQTSGLSYAQAEFLNGWITLQHKNDAEQATTHFTNLYNKVSSPISKSRGAYWLGRAYEAQGQKNLAHEWYGKAARIPVHFYGQLASTRLGQNTPPFQWDTTPSAQPSSLTLTQTQWVDVIKTLHHWGLSEHTDTFFKKLFSLAKTTDDYRYIAQLAQSIRRHDQAIRAGKIIFAKTENIPGFSYPKLNHLPNNLAKASHILGLIRQESSFHIQAQSHAGARGLMQLMPATAKETAHKIGLAYKKNALTQNPKYNTQLGVAYLEQLLKRYDGDVILATAAYNAGPGRVNGWIKTFGDPRSHEVDPIDWIESLPVYETRNYIQRVLEASKVYQALLQEDIILIAKHNHRL